MNIDAVDSVCVVGDENVSALVCHVIGCWCFHLWIICGSSVFF